MWSFRNTRIALDMNSRLKDVRYLSNKSAWVTKISRKYYLRQYPTLLVQPDGSTSVIRHYEPRKIIKLPVDFSKLNEEEQLKVLENRKPKKKVVIEEEIEDNFDASQYITLLKRSANKS